MNTPYPVYTEFSPIFSDAVNIEDIEVRHAVYIEYSAKFVEVFLVLFLEATDDEVSMSINLTPPVASALVGTTVSDFAAQLGSYGFDFSGGKVPLAVSFGMDPLPTGEYAFNFRYRVHA